MSESPFVGQDETPSVEVRVFRYGELIHRELCTSEDQASSVADAWSELEGVECLVDDLSAGHKAGDILEPEPVEPEDESYAEDVPAEKRTIHDY